MRKELYDKLNFEERCCYRIEANTLSAPQPNLLLCLIGVLVSFMCIYLDEFLIAYVLMKVTIIIVTLGFLIEFMCYCVSANKFEKEWSNRVLEKVRKNE